MSHDPRTAPDADLEQIAQHVFSRPAGKEKSVSLQLTEDSVEGSISSEEFEQMTLDIFTQIAMAGCKILWGKDFTFTNMTRDQFALLQTYMKSMGVRLNIKCNDDHADPWDLGEKEGPTAVKYLRISVEYI